VQRRAYTVSGSVPTLLDRVREEQLRSREHQLALLKLALLEADLLQQPAAVPARWRWYGHCEPRDEWFGGDHATTPEVAASMHTARIAWHPKRWSDGYGHVIHNWFSIGRPVIGSAGYYADKLAGPLFEEGVTSFDMDRLSDDELAATVRMLLGDEDRWRRMCEASADRFRAVVDFDAEAAAIRAMLENVMSDRLVRG